MDLDIIESRKLEWRLHNFTNSLLKAEKKLYSKDFSIWLENCETKWYFVAIIKNATFEIYLQKRKADIEDFTVKCEAFVRTVNDERKLYDHFLRTSNEYKILEGYGWSELFKIKEIIKNQNLYLKNNTLTIGLNVELIKQKEIVKGVSKQYLEMSKDYFATKLYSDYKFICSEATEIAVHRFILAGFSPVMKFIFDVKTEIENTLNVMDIDGETMTEILRFIYTQEVKDVEKLAKKLLYGANKYELHDLKKICGQEMAKHLSVQNALEYFILADHYNLRTLLIRSAAFIKLHHETLVENDDRWNILDREQLMTLLDCYRQNSDGIETFKSTL